MIALDTNVVIRVLVGDDPEQTPVAERAFKEGCRGDGVYLSLIVVAEVGWVLASGYRWSRASIHNRLFQLIHTHGVFTEQCHLVAEALARYVEGKAGLSDYLISESARAAGADPLLTFDQQLAQHEGVVLLPTD